MKWQYIFNPFLKISERNLFVFGLLSFLVGSLIGHLCSVTYDGIFDVHISSSTSYLLVLQENAVNILVPFALLLLLGKIINRKTRIIDILNIALGYRIPIYFISLTANIPLLDNLTKKIESTEGNLAELKFDWLELTALLAVSSVMIAALMYAIVLLVNGFRTATNLKKWQYYLGFVFVLIAAEIITKSIIYHL